MWRGLKIFIEVDGLYLLWWGLYNRMIRRMLCLMMNEEGKMGRLYTFLRSGASMGRRIKKWSEWRKSEVGIANYSSADHYQSPIPAHQTLISFCMSEPYPWRWLSPLSSLQILISQIPLLPILFLQIFSLQISNPCPINRP